MILFFYREQLEQYWTDNLTQLMSDFSDQLLTWTLCRVPLCVFILCPLAVLCRGVIFWKIQPWKLWQRYMIRWQPSSSLVIRLPLLCVLSSVLADWLCLGAHNKECEPQLFVFVCHHHAIISRPESPDGAGHDDQSPFSSWNLFLCHLSSIFLQQRAKSSSWRRLWWTERKCGIKGFF